MHHAFTRAAIAALLTLTWAAPGLGTVADELCAPAANPCIVNTTQAITPGSTLDFGTRAVQLGAQATLDVGAGALTIVAGPVQLAPGAKILARGALAGGNVTIVSSAAIDIQASGPSKGEIDVSTDGDAGLIDLQASGDITVAGKLEAVGTDQFASGGTISLTAGGGILVLPSGDVLVPGGTQSEGGDIFMDAGTGVDLQNVIDASGGDFGGGSLDIAAHAGDVFVRREIEASGGGFSGDGGFVSIDASGSVHLLAAIAGQAAGDSEDGGGSGADVEVVATQSITIAGALTLTGGLPDGEGGTAIFDAGGSITQSATIDAAGQGIDGCGGSVLMFAGGAIGLDKILLGGGSCGGGEATVTALGDLTIPQTINADGATFGLGGTVLLAGRNVSLTNVVRANSSEGDAGTITLEGCNVSVGPAGELRTIGTAGSNAIRAGGQIAVAGTMLSSTGVTPGVNQLVRREVGMTPITTGATIIPAAMLTVDATLPQCAPPGAACGDGTTDSGEQCDDGNAVACDGCSASCRTEGCGNGRVECGEQCDSGPANGTPGNACALDCTIIPTPGGLQLIPGGRSQTACQVEWVVKNPGGEITDGFPSTQQACLDGDSGCDQDGANDGKCVFDVALCLAPTDTRLPACNPPGIEYVTLQKPNVVTSTDPVDVANGQTLRDALADLGVTIRVGTTVIVPGEPVLGRDVCTPSLDVTVPHAAGLVGSRPLEVASRDTNGSRMRDNHLSLVCRPNPAVCGNGIVEVSEHCDDGNTSACDGCNASCRLEACGDGIIECDEQCDEGAANGTPESECTSSCTEKVPPLRIPGGGSSLFDCLVEFSTNTQSPLIDKHGLPSAKQDCVDNDPACDLDPTPGMCHFKVWACFGGADARIGCLAQTVSTVEVLKPNARAVGPLADLRQAMLDTLGDLTFPIANGETCSGRVDVVMAAGRKRLALTTKGRDPIGKSDRDTLRLRCLAPDS